MRKPKDLSSTNVVTLKHAADILGRERDEIDALVRREKVIPATGKRGKGGQLSVCAGDLASLEAAAELAELKIPISSIRIMIRKMDEYAGRVAMVYRRGATEIVPDPSPETLMPILSDGATGKIIDVASLRESIESRVGVTTAPPTRGRPKIDIERIRELLAATAELGDDDATPEEIAELIGPRRLPWRNEH